MAGWIDDAVMASAPLTAPDIVGVKNACVVGNYRRDDLFHSRSVFCFRSLKSAFRAVQRIDGMALDREKPSWRRAVDMRYARIECGRGAGFGFFENTTGND